MYLGLWVVLSLVGSPLAVSAQGFGQPLTPAVVTLKKARVRSLLKMIPELAKETAQYQGQFLSSMATAGDGALPAISDKDLEKLQKIYTKHGFTMEEFISELSVLLATFFALDQQAFEGMLPHEDKPEFKAILSDPAVPQANKDALRAQIKNARKNQGELQKYLASQTNEANKALLKPLLSEVRRVFKQVEEYNRGAKPKKKSVPKKK